MKPQPLLKYAGDGDLDEIHRASLEVLERCGLEVHSEKVRERLLAVGARPGTGPIVHLPAGLVEKALASAGANRVTLWSRTGRPVMPLGPYQVYFGTGSDLEFTLDHQTGETRPSSFADVGQAARLCDGLPNMDFVMSYALPAEIAPNRQDLACFLAMVQHTSKPLLITHFGDAESLEGIWRAACEIAGGAQEFQAHPFFALYAQFVSPFRHNEDSLERLWFCAEQKIPLIYIPTIMTGMSGPVTLAGSIVVANAEVLAGVTMHQAVSPGVPFIYGGCVSAFDMRNACFSYGGPEWRVADSLLGQLSRRYRLPVFSTGGCTDSKALDQQAIAEFTMSLLVPALSGCNLIHDVGYLASGMCGHLPGLVIADEVISMTRRLLRPLRVDAETMATDLIVSVGPGGQFADTDHTLRHFREETWLPDIFDRRTRPVWVAEGADTASDRATARVETILSQHEPEPLSAQAAAQVAAMERDLPYRRPHEL